MPKKSYLGGLFEVETEDPKPPLSPPPPTTSLPPAVQPPTFTGVGKTAGKSFPISSEPVANEKFTQFVFGSLKLRAALCR